jgi:hypothetical protein
MRYLVVELMQFLGSHSINVRQLKRFFSEMRPSIMQGVGVPGSQGSFTVRSLYNTAMLEALEQMTFRQGPNNFFFFDGVNSGLSIPCIDRWPQTGYAWCTWCVGVGTGSAVVSRVSQAAH